MITGNIELCEFGHISRTVQCHEVQTDTASVAYPSQFGNLATTAIIVGAVIWHAVEPFQKNCMSSRVVFYGVSPEHDSAFVLL